MEIEKEQERVPAAFKQQPYSRSEEHPDPWPLYILGQPFNKGVGCGIFEWSYICTWSGLLYLEWDILIEWYPYFFHPFRPSIRCQISR